MTGMTEAVDTSLSRLGRPCAYTGGSRRGADLAALTPEGPQLFNHLPGRGLPVSPVSLIRAVPCAHDGTAPPYMVCPDPRSMHRRHCGRLRQSAPDRPRFRVNE